jgi:hypothetical protein
MCTTRTIPLFWFTQKISGSPISSRMYLHSWCPCFVYGDIQIQLQIQFQCPLCLHRGYLSHWILPWCSTRVALIQPLLVLSTLLWFPSLHVATTEGCYRQFQPWTTPSNCRLRRPFSWQVCQYSTGPGQSFGPFSIFSSFMLHYAGCIGVFVGLPRPFSLFSF